MKKLIAILLLVIMVLSVSACGGKANSNDAGNDPAATQSAIRGITDLEIKAISTGKDTYGVGEPVGVTLEWTGTPAEDSWVGIIPAAIPHGLETVNDEADVIYSYLPDITSGKEFTFEIELEPGEYTVRVHDTDSGGIELASCDFTVK